MRDTARWLDLCPPPQYTVVHARSRSVPRVPPIPFILLPSPDGAVWEVRRATEGSTTAGVYLAHGTLVVVPSHLVEQWVAEIHKVCVHVHLCMYVPVLSVRLAPARGARHSGRACATAARATADGRGAAAVRCCSCDPRATDRGGPPRRVRFHGGAACVPMHLCGQHPYGGVCVRARTPARVRIPDSVCAVAARRRRRGPCRRAQVGPRALRVREAAGARPLGRHGHPLCNCCARTGSSSTGSSSTGSSGNRSSNRGRRQPRRLDAHGAAAGVFAGPLAAPGPSAPVAP
jgi:hypothetical protein